MTISYVSQTYIRLVRTELWKDDPKERDRRLAVYAILGHALGSIDELLHPVSPFITEYLFQETFDGGSWKVPLLARGVRRGAAGSGNQEAEKIVDLALRVEEACNSARTRAGLKRRWPLKSLKVVVAGGSAEDRQERRPRRSSPCVTSKRSRYPRRRPALPADFR